MLPLRPGSGSDRCPGWPNDDDFDRPIDLLLLLRARALKVTGSVGAVGAYDDVGAVAERCENKDGLLARRWAGRP